MPDHRAAIERFLLREWQTPTRAQWFLRPLSGIYWLLFQANSLWAQTPSKQAPHVPVPVIVVGNITVGGTGKTPLVLALIDALRAAGHAPGVILRGYRAGPHDDGDEAALIRLVGQCPVQAGRDRPHAANQLLAAHPQVDVIVSDDGLQHRALRRQCEIVVIDGERGLGNGRLLPAGPLRECIGRLSRVDAIMVHGGDYVPPVDQVPVYRMTLGHARCVRVTTGEVLSPTDFVARWSGYRLHAVAGIGHPDRFFRQLQAIGIDAEPHAFPDHHAFTAADLALGGNAQVIMTHKDAVRLGPLARPEHWYLAVDAIVPSSFFDRVLRTLHPVSHG